MDNKISKLINIKEYAKNCFDKLDLKIKPNWNIYNIHKQGLDFVGFVFKPLNTRLRKSIATKFKKTCLELIDKRKDYERDLSRIMAYKGWVKCCNGKQLWRKNTKELINFFPKQLKGAI